MNGIKVKLQRYKQLKNIPDWVTIGHENKTHY